MELDGRLRTEASFGLITVAPLSFIFVFELADADFEVLLAAWNPMLKCLHEANSADMKLFFLYFHNVRIKRSHHQFYTSRGLR